MPRDNFKKADIETLRSRVAGHCSNPDCDKVTVGPAGVGGVNRIGVAAHIHAAAPGGPRFIKEMTHQARKSLTNAIWLCNNCSRDIDNDSDRYPGDMLREWKQKAEVKARDRIGRAPLTQQSVQDQMRMMYGSAPSSFQLATIDNVHSSLANSLEEIDPRFGISTSYINGQTHVELRAKQTVPIVLRTAPSAAREFKDKLMQLFDHGQSASFEGNTTTITGSPLFGHLMPAPETTKIQFIPRSTLSVLKVVTSRLGTRPSLFAEFHGNVVTGAKSLTFNGQAYDGIVAIKLQHSMPPIDVKTDLKISYEDTLWAQRDVRHLPYFGEVAQLFQSLSSGEELDLQLFVGGLKVLGGTLTVPGGDLSIDGISNALRYLNRARVLTNWLGQQARYMPMYQFSAEQHMDLHEAAKVIEGKMTTSTDPHAFCTLTLIDDEAFTRLTEPSSSHQVQFVLDEGKVVDVYGQPIQLPPLQVTLNNVVAEVLSEHSVEQERSVKIAWRPMPGFSCGYSFSRVLDVLSDDQQPPP